MQDKTNISEVKSIDSFDAEVSLWNLVGGKGLNLLKKIADTEHMVDRDRPLSIILAGSGRNLYAQSFLRSQAMDISQTSSRALDFRNALVEFFTPSHADRGYIIDDINRMSTDVVSKVVQIMRTGEFKQYESCNRSTSLYPVFGAVVLTIKSFNHIPMQLLKVSDYCILLNPLNKEQVKQVIRMRLKYAGIEYENEEVIEMLALGDDLRSIIYVLKLAAVIMLSDNRTCLKVKDLEQTKDHF